MSDDQHVPETGTARRLWSVVAPYVDWLDSRPTTPWKGGQRSLEGSHHDGVPGLRRPSHWPRGVGRLDRRVGVGGVGGE